MMREKVLEEMAKAIAPVRQTFYRHSSKFQPNHADREMAEAALDALLEILPRCEDSAAYCYEKLEEMRK